MQTRRPTNLFLDSLFQFNLSQKWSTLGVLGLVLGLLRCECPGLSQIVRILQIRILNRKESSVKILNDRPPVVRATSNNRQRKD